MPEQSKAGPGRILLRIAAVLVSAVVLLWLVGCTYNAYAQRRLEEEIAEINHDPETGIAKSALPVSRGEGRERAVLLIHGFAGSPADFGRLPEALDDAGFRVLATLLPGHGRTPDELARVTVEDLSKHVLDAYLTLRKESERVAVVGFSIGGALSLRLARDVERMPDALVLCGPYVRIGHRWWYVLPAGTWNALVAPFVPYVVRSRDYVSLNREEGAGEFFAYNALSTQFVQEVVRLGRDLRRNPPDAVPRRTMLLYGADDSVVSLRAAKEMADRLGVPAEFKVELPRTHHRLFHDYDRHEAIQRIVEFLGESL